MNDRRQKIHKCLSLLGIFTVFLVVFFSREELRKKVEIKTIKVGISVYNQEDVFIHSIVEELERIFVDFEEIYDVRVTFDIADAMKSQYVQENHIQRYLSLGYEVLCVNVVDRTTASGIIDMAGESNIPVIFFNREPVEEDILGSDNVYYVGTDAEETALLQASLIEQHWKKNGTTFDQNHNNTIEYVMLEGEIGHQDSLIRTQVVIQTLKEQGTGLYQIASDVANWSRSQAKELMKNWLKTYGERIEMVIANNDQMALGAIDAIEEMGFESVQVVGVDGVEEALEAIEENKMFGTVDCQIKEQAKAIAYMTYILGTNRSFDGKIKLDKGRYYRIPSSTIMG